MFMFLSTRADASGDTVGVLSRARSSGLSSGLDAELINGLGLKRQGTGVELGKV